jgi:putative transcriptional regulator
MPHSVRTVAKKKKQAILKNFVSLNLTFNRKKMYKTIDIDRENLTLMGVKFSDLETLERTANAIGTNMFEGFEPTKELLQLYVDWKAGLLSETDFLGKLYAIYGK